MRNRQIGPGEEVDDILMGEHNPLRNTGRAGGIHQIGKIGRIAVGKGRLATCCVRINNLFRVQAEFELRLLAGDDQRGRAVLNHEGNPLHRIGGIKRQIGGARLQDGQQGHHQIGRSFQAEPDNASPPGTALNEGRGEGIRAPVKLGICQYIAIGFEGGRLWCLSGLLSDDLMNAFIARIGNTHMIHADLLFARIGER